MAGGQLRMVEREGGARQDGSAAGGGSGGGPGCQLRPPVTPGCGGCADAPPGCCCRPGEAGRGWSAAGGELNVQAIGGPANAPPTVTACWQATMPCAGAQGTRGACLGHGGLQRRLQLPVLFLLASRGVGIAHGMIGRVHRGLRKAWLGRWHSTCVHSRQAHMACARPATSHQPPLSEESYRAGLYAEVLLEEG